jgi:hypothetical protein
MTAKRLTATLTAALLILVLAACGGNDATAEDYVGELDTACEDFQTKLEEIPAVQREEGLSTEETRDLAVQYADEFEAAVADAEAPSDLEDTAQELSDKVSSPPPSDNPDPAEFIAYYEELLALYEEVGADACAEIQSTQIQQLEQLSEQGLFEDQPGD